MGNASLDVVWNKLTNFENYPKWNQFITKIEGEKINGKTLLVDILPPGGSRATFKPILTKFEKNKELRWVGILGKKWLFRGEHYFKLNKNVDGTISLTHGEIFTGLLVPLFNCLAGKKTEAGFKLMNENLKTGIHS